ncbi:hypothetical protein CK203_007485 [Vitis vinifera]|uniref:Retrotransposon Copia-like N-terminal domain-containing protein n=1 Tax=Vitis vinifera TaxID=29760 RepID=A0A438G179_VITVI|nr:hypothetical protein CK203_007485 [Vitis vinifera]
MAKSEIPTDFSKADLSNSYFTHHSDHPEETDPEGYATWSRCNDMVHSWIVNTLNLEIADICYSRENPPDESSPLCPPSILLCLSIRKAAPPHFDKRSSGICCKCCYGRAQQRQIFDYLEGRNRSIEHKKDGTD